MFVRVRVDHVVEVSNLAVLVADDRKVQLGALGLVDVGLPTIMRSTVDETAINCIALVEITLASGKGAELRRADGREVFGCEKRIPSCRPIVVKVQ